MLKEEYVSFETAKLLKEKGFNEECSSWYSTKGNQYYDIDSYEVDLDGITKLCPAPSQQMVMKWLREEKKVFIEPFVSIDLNRKYHFCFRLLNSECKDILQPKDLINIDFKDSYEEAVEEALKYCLTKLI